MKQFLLFFKITLSLLLLLQMGDLSAQFISRPATFVSVDKPMTVGSASQLLDGEGATGLLSSGKGPFPYFYWIQSNNPVVFSINMNEPSTVSNMRFYECWGTNEHVKDVSLRLFNGATLLGTESATLQSNYATRFLVTLSQRYSNVTNVEFTVINDQNTSASTPKRASLTELVLGDYDCVNFPNTIAAGVDRFLCLNSTMTQINFATTNATGATFTGLPTGVTGSWSGNVARISGTPTVAGSYNYVITATGNNCPPAYAIGSLTVGVSPILRATAIRNACPATTVNLSSLAIGALPAGTSLHWYSDNTRTNLVANPTQVATSGTYYAFFYNAANNCFSPASAGVTVTVANCCTTPPSVN